MTPWLVKLVAVAGLLLATAAPTVAAPQRTLTLWLDPAAGALRGEMRLALPASGRFRLAPAFRLTAVERRDETLAVTREAAGRYRVVAPPGPVTVRWQGRPAGDGEPPDQAPQLSASGGLLPARSGWHPRVAAPRAGPLTLVLHTPPGQRAVGSGSLVEERRHADGITARYTHPRTRDLEVATGPWRLRERRVDGIRLRTLFPATLDAAFAETYLEHAVDFLEAFQARLGRYPFASFTMAASPAPVGLAFPGFTLLGEKVIPLPFIPTTSLGHELMHAWWGGAVGIDYARGNWAEALTTYLADYARAEAQGEGMATRRRWLTDLSALPEDQEMPLVAFRGGAEPVVRLIGYQHGAMVFHMLRRRLGEPVFQAGLRRFAETQRFRTADWRDLRVAFESASGSPLGPFFEAWLTRPGRPTLALEAVSVTVTGSGFVLRGRLLQQGEGAPWPLAVPLAVATTAGSEHRVVEAHEERTSFSLTLRDRPLALTVDPDFQVLRRLNAIPALLRGLTLDPATRVLPLDDAPLALGQRILGRDAEPATKDSRAGTPLLVIGPTEAVADWRETHGLPRPPRPLARAGQARMWTLPGTRVALVSADTREALARLSGALRHHRGRSYVVQDAGGTTLEAGTWPAPPASPHRRLGAPAPPRAVAPQRSSSPRPALP
ncbi:M1 family metallopeptidase [Halomonas nitroreducens]|uniref:M1 family peptidase n=1 Tax=Halomonas nitroreducens TaxID=447425 RepID=A0A431V789_9GAMM|nr:M1 family aminopeptidase [Halomonas nitroreducens]RTR05933.1 M1 family peptidase [Halomonas nitroreducens]